PVDLQNLEAQAAKLYEAVPDWNQETFPEEVTEDKLPTPEMKQWGQAHRFLFRYRSFRRLTNYPHFFYRTQLESTPEAVAARRLFYEADYLKKKGRSPAAILKLYDDPKGVAAWRSILLNN